MTDKKTFDDALSAQDISVDANRNILLDALEGEIEIEYIKGIHPADFSDLFEQLTADQREYLIETAPEIISADILAYLEDEVVEDILPLLPSAQITAAIVELDNDDATQIVEEMEDEQRERKRRISFRNTLSFQPLLLTKLVVLWV